MSALFLGLMSGTSQDGVDAVLAEFAGTRLRRLRATHSVPYPAPLRRELLRLAATGRALTYRDHSRLDAAVADAFARAAAGALRRARVPARRVQAIGSHGQTVFHAATGRVRGSVQLGDPNRIAARTGIPVVADLRRMDLALGGQGAPLVPAFHHAVFAAREPRCVLNLGGIANVTVLPGRRPGAVTGFDTGPGNALLDEWVQHHRRGDFDRGGRWAARGTPHAGLLRALLSDPWFRRPPPRSTGRGEFNLAWARRRYPGLGRLDPADVQATFAELTARTVAAAIARFAPRARRVLVCGGGVRNTHLMRRLRALLPCPVESTRAHGLDPQSVEAAAFAWLAVCRVRGLPGNIPGVTGARSVAVLGGIYAPPRGAARG